jgi:2,4-dienoyl-CoA reductase-like NADH-dependent reductase (Old Yellow Enzyme family)
MTNSPFVPTTLGRLTLKNRFIRSAAWDGMGFNDGSFSPAQVELFRNLSLGGAGLLTSGFIAVTPQGRRNREQNLLCENRHVQSLRKIVEVVKREEVALFAQLVHCGGYASTETSNLPIVAPSDKQKPIFEEKPQALTENEIKEVITQFAEAAARAREAGCDGVQIHAAHGYLVSQFLSPCTNQRADNYGGSPENRTRFLIEVYEKVRKYVGTDFTVTIKINGSDYFPDGLTSEESLKITQQLAKLGLDGVEVSGGNPISIPLTPIPKEIQAGDNEVPFKDEILSFTESLSIPVTAVAGIRSLETIEELISKGVSFISLCRPLICEPDLINQWQAGREEPSRCTSCNRCFIPAFKGKGIKCNKKIT